MTADQALPLLELVRAEGKRLLENAQLSGSAHQGWEMGVRNWLEKAFGEGAPEVSRVMNAGPARQRHCASTAGFEAILTRERLETLRAQVSQLEAAMNILRAEASILPTATTDSTGAQRMPAPHDIFISQTERDEPVVKALIDLIEKALKLPSAKIRCTSIPGYKLTGGADIAETLRGEIEACAVFLAVLTSGSDESAYVASEIGARWMTRRPAKLLLGGGFAPKNARGPLAQTHMLNLSSETDLHQLVRELASEIGVQPEPTDAYLRHLQAVLAASQNAVTVAPRPAAASQQPQWPELTAEQERVLAAIVVKADRGISHVVPKAIATELRLTQTVARHLFDQLRAIRMLEHDGMDHTYALTEMGRAYAVNKLLSGS